MVKTLIALGIDIEETDKNGDTTLQQAIKNRQEAITKVLLQFKANTAVKDKEENTLLHLAIQKENLLITYYKQELIFIGLTNKERRPYKLRVKRRK